MTCSVTTTPTVRFSEEDREFSEEDRERLPEPADEHGGNTGAIRRGLLPLAHGSGQRTALREFLGEWAEEADPPESEDVTTMRGRYFAS